MCPLEIRNLQFEEFKLVFVIGKLSFKKELRNRQRLYKNVFDGSYFALSNSKTHAQNGIPNYGKVRASDELIMRFVKVNLGIPNLFSSAIFPKCKCCVWCKSEFEKGKIEPSDADLQIANNSKKRSQALSCGKSIYGFEMHILSILKHILFILCNSRHCLKRCENDILASFPAFEMA